MCSIPVWLASFILSNDSSAIAFTNTQYNERVPLLLADNETYRCKKASFSRDWFQYLKTNRLQRIHLVAYKHKRCLVHQHFTHTSQSREQAIGKVSGQNPLMPNVRKLIEPQIIAIIGKLKTHTFALAVHLLNTQMTLPSHTFNSKNYSLSTLHLLKKLFNLQPW